MSLMLIQYLVIAFCVTRITAIDLWEFTFGPRLKPADALLKLDLDQKIPEKLAKSFGYRLDTHLLTSETGHVISLHRIPKGRKSGYKQKNTNKKPVVLIHHGLFGSSDMWLLKGPQYDLPYFLADAGFDVWLFNARGNSYSRRHKTLNPDTDSAYWQFGMEEVGYYDLAASIDHILNVTETGKMFFVGHSLGTSTCLILCSMRPEYNEKIQLLLALGPLATIKHTLNPLHKLTFSLAPILINQLLDENIYEMLPRRPHFIKLLEILCQTGSPTQKLCMNTIFQIVGTDFQQLNLTSFSYFIRFYPAGTSMQMLLNVLQYYLTGNFARYDYGNKFMNVLHYNSTTPPNYDLSRVTVPVSLHFGKGDLLVSERDIESLESSLPNVIGKFPVPYKNFNHLDFILANEAKTLLYEKLLSLMQKFLD